MELENGIFLGVLCMRDDGNLDFLGINSFVIMYDYPRKKVLLTRKRWKKVTRGYWNRKLLQFASLDLHFIFTLSS